MLQAILVLLCWAIAGGGICGGIGAFVGGNRGATIGAILGFIAEPAGLILFWAAVISTGIFGSG